MPCSTVSSLALIAPRPEKKLNYNIRKRSDQCIRLHLKPQASLAFRKLQVLTISARFQKIDANNNTVGASRLTKDMIHEGRKDLVTCLHSFHNTIIISAHRKTRIIN